MFENKSNTINTTSILLEKLYNSLEIKKEVEGLLVNDVELEFRSWNICDAEINELLKLINPRRYELQKKLLQEKAKLYHTNEKEDKDE